jgi:hypothetical protein
MGVSRLDLEVGIPLESNAKEVFFGDGGREKGGDGAVSGVVSMRYKKCAGNEKIPLTLEGRSL